MDLWNKYKGPLIFYGIVSVLLMITVQLSERNPQWKFIDFCVVPSTNNFHKKFIRFTRGRQYWTAKDRKKVYADSYDRLGKGIPEKFENNDTTECGNCLVTSWNISHVLMYMIMGYLFPNILLEIVFIGIMFEILETTWDCYDMMDLVWNTSGYMIGALARNYLNPII